MYYSVISINTSLRIRNYMREDVSSSKSRHVEMTINDFHKNVNIYSKKD